MVGNVHNMIMKKNKINFEFKYYYFLNYDQI